MVYRIYIPRSPLSELVECFWLYQGDASSHAKERLLPTGTVELVIDLTYDKSRIYDRDDPDKFQTLGAALIAGPHSQPFIIDAPNRGQIIGVHFKPGGAFPFLKLPAGELQDSHVSLEMLWGIAAFDLRDRLLEAETPELKFQLLEHYLLAQATLPLTRHRAVGFALKEFHRASPAPTISDVTERVGLSRRHFIQLFSNEVGLTPKLFCRVWRFQQVIQRIGKLQSVDWTNVALDCGYFDQAHFNHDFKAFSGLNPTAYLTYRDREHLNHIPLPD